MLVLLCGGKFQYSRERRQDEERKNADKAAIRDLVLTFFPITRSVQQRKLKLLMPVFMLSKLRRQTITKKAANVEILIVPSVIFRWRNSICNFCWHFRCNIYVVITHMLNILSKIETYTTGLSPQNRQILPRSSPLKMYFSRSPSQI